MAGAVRAGGPRAVWTFPIRMDYFFATNLIRSVIADLRLVGAGIALRAFKFESLVSYFASILLA